MTDIVEKLRELLATLPPEDYRAVSATWTDDGLGGLVTFSVSVNKASETQGE